MFQEVPCNATGKPVADRVASPVEGMNVRKGCRGAGKVALNVMLSGLTTTGFTGLYAANRDTVSPPAEGPTGRVKLKKGGDTMTLGTFGRGASGVDARFEQHAKAREGSFTQGPTETPPTATPTSAQYLAPPVSLG